MALAQQMHESHDFSAMPILADALQDAGRDNADVLDHCRVPPLTHALIRFHTFLELDSAIPIM